MRNMNTAVSSLATTRHPRLRHSAPRLVPDASRRPPGRPDSLPDTTRVHPRAAGRLSTATDTGIGIAHDIGTIMRAEELPGPLSMNHLADVGAVRALDEEHAYLSEPANTLYGRGSIVLPMMPYGAVSCAMTAAWVWLGGDFPKTFDVISPSHFRTPVYGRRIRVFNRTLPAQHETSIAGLRLTTPVRTACDIAMLTACDRLEEHTSQTIRALMEKYRFGPSDCMETMQGSRYCRNAPQARRFFCSIRHRFP